MEAKELRVGNWVNYTKGGEKQGMITSTSKDRVVIDNKHSIKTKQAIYNSPLLHGIPLTEEILLKAGFADKGHPDYDWILNIPNCRDSNFLDTLGIIRWGDGTFELYKRGSRTNENTGDEAMLCEVKYVHQLQNLYFALTGTELEIDLTNGNK